MTQIFVANPKGGCGKTTISAQLAGYFSDHGVPVLLMDHDAQRSSHDWLQSRPAACSDIALEVDDADTPSPTTSPTNTYKLIIHDMPAACSLSHITSRIRPKDVVIIPVLPSPTDIKACVRFLMSLYRKGFFELDIKVGLIANRVKMRTCYFKVLQAFLSRLQLPLVSTLRDTQNYVRVMDSGLTIFDLPPSRVRKDRESWDAIFQWLESEKIVQQFVTNSASDGDDMLLSA